MLTSLGIYVLKVNHVQSLLTQTQITLRLNAQCNFCVDGNLAQTISISLSSFTKSITHTHTHTRTHAHAHTRAHTHTHSIHSTKFYDYKHITTEVKFIHAQMTQHRVPLLV